MKNKWDEAIQDAKAKLSALRKTLKYFEEMKKKRMPWPRDSAGFLCSDRTSYAGGSICAKPRGVPVPSSK
jgi:hypothetical protein